MFRQMNINKCIYRFLPEKIKQRVAGASDRTMTVYKHILISFIAKAISVIVPILVVPLTISYVTPTQYGVWLTLSSIISWMSIFDLGLGNGFRNKYAEAAANGDLKLAKQYVSTVYVTISVLMAIVFVLITVVNNFIDWSQILKIDASYKEELQKVFGILSLFFCLSMIVNLFSTLLNADQKPGTASLIHSAGQVLSLIVIFFLTKFTSGSLIKLALYFSSVPCLLMIFISIFGYHSSKYKAVAPSINCFRKNLVSEILSLGIQFFIIQISIILVFQIVNIVLSREIGPEAVTQYNISQRYYSILTTIVTVISVPFWSAFTDAYTKKDFNWMKSTIRKLEVCWICLCVLGILMQLISPWFYHVWIGDTVSIPWTLSVSMMLFSLSSGLENIYVYLINGIGTIRIQMIIYVVFALVAWPALVFASRTFGVAGALIVPSLTYFIQAIFAKIQLNKVLEQKATGIWCK